MIIYTDKTYRLRSDYHDRVKCSKGWAFRWRELQKLAFSTMGTKCLKCGESKAKLHVDHILPYSKYPHLRLSAWNVQILCAKCNVSKGNTDESDYRSSGHIKKISRYISKNKLTLTSVDIDITPTKRKCMNKWQRIAAKKKRIIEDMRKQKPKCILRKKSLQ